MVQRDTRRQDLEYHTLSDFRPGIYARTDIAPNGNLASYPISVPDGAAQLDETEGCVALPSGSLAPGPHIDLLPQAAGTAISAGNTAAIPLAAGGGNGLHYITGALAVGPIFNDASPFSSYEEYKFEALCFHSFSLWVHTAPNNNIGQGIFHVFKGWGTELQQAFGYTSLLGNNGNCTFIPGSTFADIQTIRTADAHAVTLPGYPCVMAAHGFGFQGLGADTGISGGGMFIFPDINTASGDTDNFAAYTPAGAVYGIQVVAHQGRIVYSQRASNRSWSANGFSAYYSTLGYQTANDIFAAATSTLIIPDLGLDGIYSLYSVNASELVAIRGRGGAISIRGDLDNPTIVRYPGVQGTEGYPNIGTNTPLGYVYGSRSGIFAWKGGDESTYISPQLPGAFWVSTMPDDNLIRRKINMGSFAYSAPYIFAPNNFIYDTQNNSWWRYLIPGHNTDSSVATEQTACGFHTTGPYSGDVYALYYAVPFVASTAWNTGFRISKNIRSNHYIWKSHPLSWSRGRTIEVREVLIAAQGEGNIVITLSSQYQPDSTRTVTFTLVNHPNDKVRLVATCGFTGNDVIMKIECTAGANGYPAPTVHEVTLGEMKRQSIDRVTA